MGGAPPEDTAARPKGRRAGRTILRVAVSAGLLALLLWQGDVDLATVGAYIGTALRDSPDALLGALLLYGLLGSLARGKRWQALVRPLGYPIALARATELFLVGTFYNQILPTGMGGDVPKALLVARDGGALGIGRARAASSVLVDRAMGLLPLLAVGLLALAIAPKAATPAVALLLVAAGLAGLAGLTVMVRSDLWRPIGERLPVVGWVLRRRAVANFVASFAAYGGGPLWASAGWGLVFTALLVAANGLLGRAVGITTVSWLEWLIVVPLVALSILLPSIGGWGVREVSYVALLGSLTPAVSPDAATAVSLLFQALNMLMALVGGLLFLVRGDVSVKEQTLAERGAAAGPGFAEEAASERPT
jgi:hypothetical protein